MNIEIIPAFRDIKNHLDNSDVHKILSDCLFDGSPDEIAKAIEKYREHIAWQMYGWVENDEILGVCGFEVHADYLEILHVSVAEHARYHGIGRSMITALQKQYDMPIEAETDDEAVKFYRKCGFETSAIQKYNVRRWTCVLPAPKASNQENDKEQQAKIYPIILSEYNPAWAEWFAEEKANLERLIGVENIARISHYGSTSVPGLTAKPTVDILLEISESTNADNLIAALSSPDYICLNPPDMPTPPPHLMFLKGYLPDGFAEKVYHIHIRYPGDPDELYFRDYLIAHPEVAAEYAELKRRLFQDYEHDRDGYTEAKTDFIRTITRKARNQARFGED